MSSSDRQTTRQSQLEKFRGSETILVVEDAEAVRQLVERYLLRLGYQVLCASEWGEAELLCERHPGPIHLLITDVILPKVDGVEVARRVEALRPGVRVLYMSGFSDGLVGGPKDRDANFVLLQKPFTPTQLLRMVRARLDADAPAPLASPEGVESPASMSDALYKPGDWMWQVNRESVLLLSGPRALLMQVAHPLVAAGVAQHSNFEQDPLARLRGTLDAMLGMIYGSREEAERHAARVGGIHEHVHGTLRTDTPAFPAGSAYDALDPSLLFWVQATLIDSALCAYECFVAPLTAEQRAEFYEESKSMAPLLRLPLDSLPATYADFRRSVDAMIEGPSLSLTDDARAIANAVLYPRIWQLPRGVWRAASVIPLGLLPPTLRARYGFRWNRSHELAWRSARASIRLLLPLLPQTARIMPRAREAERERNANEGAANFVRRTGSSP